MSSTLQDRRIAPIRRTVEAAREIAGRQAVDRQALGEILQHLEQLAREDGLWTTEAFPCLDEQTRQTRYLLHEDEACGIALYLIVWLPGRHIAPHNHTTWACIAPVAGAERNTLFERVDGGAGPGHAVIRQCGVRIVNRAEGGLTLLPDDIHAVDIVGTEPTVNLHLYGRPLESLEARLAFDAASHSAAVRGVGVPSVVWQPAGA
jgi:predicted metal-dependent enzyme (double-stranded beta helix superfamily)